jgi:hypothetical protein
MGQAGVWHFALVDCRPSTGRSALAARILQSRNKLCSVFVTAPRLAKWVESATGKDRLTVRAANALSPFRGLPDAGFKVRAAMLVCTLPDVSTAVAFRPKAS